MSGKIRIVYAALDKIELTLYSDKGETYRIPQGSYRIQALLDKVVPGIEAEKFCDIDESDLVEGNTFLGLEKLTKGFVTYVRMAKAKLDEILKHAEQVGVVDEQPVEGLVIGVKPGSEAPAPSVPVEVPAAAQVKAPTKTASAVAEIMANSKPAASFAPGDEVKETETVVAVLDDGSIIPGMEKLTAQFKGVIASLGSPKGIENFLRRVASVERKHSVEDLLTFMQKGELPIADDGSVLVYKLLMATKDEGIFVDCHSKNVRQKVGSHVYMDEKLVDANRSNECSNGLHVARRDYLRSFSGDVCVLAKLAPEDVIAVPHGDARKLRAKGYHIIARLNSEDASLVRRNQPMKDTVLLGNAVAGNHIGITQLVEIRAAYGGNLVTTELDDDTAVEVDQSLVAESLDSVAGDDGQARVTNTATVLKQVNQAKSGSGLTVTQRFAILVADMNDAKSAKAALDAAEMLNSSKRAAKKGWAALGVSEADVATMQMLIDSEGSSWVAPVVEEEETVANVAVPEGSPRQQIRTLLDSTQLSAMTKATATQIAAIKKKAKKGWVGLGVSPKEQQKIEKLIS